MALNGAQLNGAQLNGTQESNVLFTLPGFDAASVYLLRPLGTGFRIGGIDAEYSAAGVFFWNSDLDCTLEPIFAADQPTVFDSIRDDGDCNRLQHIRNNCLGIVEITHSCILGEGE